MADQAAPTRYFQVAGFILAGGDSSRMGQDKASLEIGGLPLVVRIAQMMEPLVSKRAGVTVIGPPDRYAKTALKVLPDERPGQGPLGGIHTALKNSVSPWAVILGCDMPYVTQKWLSYLFSRAVSSKADVVVPEGPSGPEPLCAMYHKRCEPFFYTALAAGTRKITDAFVGREVEMVTSLEWEAFDPSGLLFKSVNTPGELAEAQARFGAV